MSTLATKGPVPAFADDEIVPWRECASHLFASNGKLKRGSTGLLMLSLTRNVLVLEMSRWRRSRLSELDRCAVMRALTVVSESGRTLCGTRSCATVRIILSRDVMKVRRRVGSAAPRDRHGSGGVWFGVACFFGRRCVRSTGVRFFGRWVCVSVCGMLKCSECLRIANFYVYRHAFFIYSYHRYSFKTCRNFSLLAFFLCF